MARKPPISLILENQRVVPFSEFSDRLPTWQMRATIQPGSVFRIALACSLAALASCGGSAGITDPAPGPGGNATIQFDGDSGTGNPPTYKDHPDMAVAANGTQVVETTGQHNQCVQLFRKPAGINADLELHSQCRWNRG
jgi:hypothetical protein